MGVVLQSNLCFMFHVSGIGEVSSDGREHGWEHGWERECVRVCVCVGAPVK